VKTPQDNDFLGFIGEMLNYIPDYLLSFLNYEVLFWIVITYNYFDIGVTGFQRKVVNAVRAVLSTILYSHGLNGFGGL
jgi:hypothetical protein